MKFSDIYGNENLKDVLTAMVDTGKVHHAIMLYENDGGSGVALALAFLQYLNCSHRSGADSCGKCASCNQNSKLIYPDVRFIFPVARKDGDSNVSSDDYLQKWREFVISNPYFTESELFSSLGLDGKKLAIPVAEARKLISKLSVAPISEGYRSVMIYLPEMMNVQTANVLLKSIEEPTDKDIFIMVTHQPEKLLPTIKSRCLLMRVMPLSAEEVADTLENRFSVSRQDAMDAAANSGGSVGVALRNLAEAEDDSEMKTLFTNLIGSIVSRDYLQVLDCGEAIAMLDSREKQKGFCKFASSCIRKIFMVQQKLDDISGIPDSEMGFYKKIAASCGKTFCRKTAADLDRAAELVGRNVNQKIVFTGLVSRMFFNI